jgi:uncharacterized repeat protein (TIGR01451 family)
MNTKGIVRGRPPFLNIGFSPSTALSHIAFLKTMKIRRIVTILIFMVLFLPAIFQIQGYVVAEPTIQEPDTGPHTATWTFDNPADFNTTETKIALSEVKLQTHEFMWNYSNQDDFNSGDRVNVTLTQSDFPEVIWSDDFEHEGNGSWERFILALGLNEWEHGEVADVPEFIGSYNSGSYVWGTKLNGTYDDSLSEPRDYVLRSPSIDLTNSVNTKMTFWHYYSFESETDWNDGGRVEISIDDGLTWIPKFPVIGYPGQIESPANKLVGESCFVGYSSAWIQETFDLSSHDGEASLIIRFRFATDGLDSDYGWYIDDVEITSSSFSDGEVELSSRNVEVGTEAANVIQKPANETVIDNNNPVNVHGLLTEWKVSIEEITSSPAYGKMKIFREEGGQFVWINETDLVEVFEGTNIFTCEIEVLPGDYIGWYGENASIHAKSEGISYLMSGDIKETKSKSEWTEIPGTYSIKAWGQSRFPVGTLTSRVFNAGSVAIWKEIKWDEEVLDSVVDIVFETRSGNDSDTDHSSWSGWSPELSNPESSLIRSPNSQFIQFRATLKTMKQPYTPVLKSISLVYEKYSSFGVVETDDVIPDVVVQWRDFTVDEILNGQNIDYFYSLDSGVNWIPITMGYDFSSVSIHSAKIRFKVNLTTQDTTVTPVIRQMSITYSTDTPQMGLYIEIDKETAKPGETVSYRVYFNNSGPGEAKDVTITLNMDNNLTYIEDTSEVSSTIESGNIIKWHYDTVEVTISGSKLFVVDAKVKDDLDKEATVAVRATLSYTDIGGNQYDKVISNGIAVDIEISEDLFAYYLSIGAIIVTILIITLVLLFSRYKAFRETEANIGAEDVDSGIGYLVMEENPSISYGIFSELIDEGHNGLCITRTFPSRVKANYYFEGVSILWLSRTRDKDSILPTNLSGVLSHVKDFMEQNENPVILLDGLEYLMVHSDFQKVLKLVHGLNELSAIYDARLLIPLNPLTMDIDKIALLKRDLKILG